MVHTLDRQLHLIYPGSTRPFGGLNIVLCGDPAQLPPVLAQPLYAHRGSDRLKAARFHLFNTVVQLDMPFRQTGHEDTLVRFLLCSCLYNVLIPSKHSYAFEKYWNDLLSAD